MNYLHEINCFYSWLERNPISSNAIVLWSALMSVNNKAGWIKEFTVSLSSLEMRTNLSKAQIYQARKTLEKEGRIRWKVRGGKRCAIYTLISFEEQTECEPSGESNATINKLNKKKLNKTISLSNDDKSSLVINQIDDSNSKIKNSKKKSVFDFRKENFETSLDAEQHSNHNCDIEIQILTGGAAADDDFELMDNQQDGFSCDGAWVADEPTTDQAWVSDAEVDDDDRKVVELVKPIVNIDYQRYVKYFNNRCKRLSKVTVLTKQRKNAIRLRLQQYDHRTILKMINEAAESDFLSGENERGWKATFDWLFRPNNFVKVLEGNYANSNIKFQGGIQNGYKPSHFELIKEAFEGYMEANEFPIDLNPHEL